MSGLMIVALSVAVLTAGCADQVTKEQVEAGIVTELQGQGRQAEDLNCPDDLVAEVGQATKCTFAVNGQPVDAIATVTGIDTDVRTAHYEIITAPHPVGEQLLEQRIGKEFENRLGRPVEEVDCDADLPATVGGTMLCTVDRDRRVQVTVTSVNLGEVVYDVTERP